MVRRVKLAGVARPFLVNVDAMLLGAGVQIHGGTSLLNDKTKRNLKTRLTEHRQAVR